MTTAFARRVLAGLTLLTIASPLAAFADDVNSGTIGISESLRAVSNSRTF